jgi:hypothetical protein
MALDEAGDGGVIGVLLSGDHAACDVLHARALDRPRGPRSTRPAIEQQSDHHRRLVGRSTVTILAIRGIERRRVDHRDHIDHEPREVILRQPLLHVGRQQERLLAIARDEVLRHAEIVLNPPDSSPTPSVLRDNLAVHEGTHAPRLVWDPRAPRSGGAGDARRPPGTLTATLTGSDSRSPPRRRLRPSIKAPVGVRQAEHLAGASRAQAPDWAGMRCAVPQTIHLRDDEVHALKREVS